MTSKMAVRCWLLKSKDEEEKEEEEEVKGKVDMAVRC